jgi:hypothetical protein
MNLVQNTKLFSFPKNIFIDAHAYLLGPIGVTFAFTLNGFKYPYGKDGEESEGFR